MRGLSFILLLLFTACTSEYITVDDAIADGTIAQSGGVVATISSFDTVQVQKQNIERNMELSITGGFVIQRQLSFEQSGGEFTNIIQSPAGTRVKEGDILATQFFSERESESYEIERRRLEFEINLFETRIRNERRLHQENIANARNESNELYLNKLQLQFNRFNNNTNEQRANLNERMENLSPITNNLYAPFDGILTQVSNAQQGSSISAGHVYFTIADESSFEFRVNSLPEVVRFGNIFTINSDYISFDAIVVSDSMLDIGNSIRQYSLQPVDIESFNNKLAELNITAFDLLDANLRLEISEVLIVDALILPNRAIRQEVDAQYVIIHDNERFLKRYITTGFTFSTYTQILMGVEDGQVVVMP